MSKLDEMKDQQFLFGAIHIIANKKETLIERELAEFGVTFKQWLLLAVIQNSFDKAPTLNEAAGAMGSSHQNIKRIAVMLEQKGYILLEKDKRDSRAKRIHLTPACEVLANSIRGKAAAFNLDLFRGIDAEEMAKARIVLSKMMGNLAHMENKTEEEENKR